MQNRKFSTPSLRASRSAIRDSGAGLVMEKDHSAKIFFQHKSFGLFPTSRKALKTNDDVVDVVEYVVNNEDRKE